MAFFGQTWTQTPHPVHLLTSTFGRSKLVGVVCLAELARTDVARWGGAFGPKGGKGATMGEAER